jgi:hypothetical protein
MSIQIKGDINKLPNVKKKQLKEGEIKRNPIITPEGLKKQLIEKDEIILQLRTEIDNLKREIESALLRTKKSEWVKWRLGVNGR